MGPNDTPALRPRNSLTTVVPRLYEWVLGFSRSPYGILALFLLAVAESSFFPIPPDVLLIALGVGASHRVLWFAGVTTLGSVIGAGFGYVIGLQFYELAGRPIIDFYGLESSYARVQQLYQDWDALAVGIAGFTPIPYKVFTIAAGAFKIDLSTFFAASVVSRGARFFLIGGLILWFGPSIRRFIERYLNLLTIIFMVLLVGGFLILRYVVK